MNRRLAHRSWLLATAAMLPLAAAPAAAQTSWNGTTSTNWFTPGNWSAGVPTAATTTSINTVTPNPTVIDGAAAVSGALNVGTASASTGNLTIQNAATLATTGSAIVGAGGHVGPTQPFGTGAVLATGVGSAWTVSGALRLGGQVTLGGVPPGFGAGQLTVANGAIVTSGSATIYSRYNEGIGHQPTDPESKALVTGAGSIWNAGALSVSGDENGPFDHLAIAAGGVVNSTTSGVTGRVRVTGPGSVWNTGLLGIGQTVGFGHGQLFIENGATVNTTGDALIAAGATVSGAGSTWNISGNLNFGTAFNDAAFATLEISRGATVNVANGGGTVTLGSGATPGFLSFLTIGAGAATAPGTLNAASVVLNDISALLIGHNATNYVFAPLISGNGALGGAAVIHSSGTTTFTANNTYTGRTQIDGGTLQLGNGGATGAVAGDIAIANGAALAINRTGTLALNGAFSGSGSLTQTGTVTTTLGGSGAAFTGATTINGGTMLVNGNFGSSAFTVNSGGTLGGTGTVGTTTINGGGTIAPGTTGVGELTVNGLLTFQQNANYIAEVTSATADRITVNGSGANLMGRLIATDLGGAYVPGQYTLMTATNGFFNTRFNSLATTPGSFSGLAPSLVYSGNTLFLNLAAATPTATWLASPGSNDYWTGSNWTGGSVPNGTAFFNATDRPNIEFINPVGSPQVIIGSFEFGANAPAYTFTMASDTVTFNGAGIVNNSSFRPTFNVGNRSLLEFINTSTAANAVINAFGSAGRVQFRDNSTAASAVITVGDGIGFGLVDFFESSTAGNANINNVFGTTIFRDNSTAGGATIANSSALIFGNSASAGTATITNNSGGGILIHTNATADTARIINNAGATVDVSNTNVPGGAPSVGIGSLSGAGNVFLGARNLTLGNLNLNDTISGVIADGGDSGGTGGSLTKVGTGILTLTADNTYTGGTTINAGSIQLGNGGATGTILGNIAINNAQLDINRTGNLALTGVISGNGGISHTNHDLTTTMTGISPNFTGGIALNRGTLLVDGSIPNSTIVVANAVLGGNGTVGTTTIFQGFLSPGSSPGPSIGLLTVDGDLTLNTVSTYIVDVSPTAADRVTVTGAATLAGTVGLVFGPGAYNSNTYTILSAGTVTGEFTNITTSGLPSYLTADIDYTPTEVLLVTLSSHIETTACFTANQCAAARAQDTAFNNSLPTVPGLIGLPDAFVPTALDALSGELHATLQGGLFEDSRFIRNAILGRLRQASFTNDDGAMGALASGGPELANADPRAAYAASMPVKAGPLALPIPETYTLWGTAFGAWARTDSDGNAAEVRRRLGGFVSGFDRRFGNWRLGVAGGYTAANTRVAARASTADVDSAHIAGYAASRFGPLNVRGGAALAWQDFDTRRSVAFPGFADELRARYHGTTAQVFGEVGYAKTYGRFAVEPFAGIALVNLSTNAFTETGGAAALGGAAESHSMIYSSLGIRAATVWMMANGRTLTPRASVAWQHAFNDVTPAAALRFLNSGVAFNIAGAPIARDSALVEAGADLAIGRSTTIGVSYVGQLARDAHDHAVKARGLMRF